MFSSDHSAVCLPPVHGPPTLSLSLLQGCITNVEKWLLENCGVILGICAVVAVIEVQSSSCLIFLSNPFYQCCLISCQNIFIFIYFLQLLGMILSMFLCKSVVQEDYSKVPKY